MAERDPVSIGRRRFLRLGAKAGVATVLGGVLGSKAYENRTFGPDYDISPQTAELLKPKAEEIKKYMKAGKFDTVIVIGGGSDGSPSQPAVNLDTMSRALTYLSYLDGGVSEVDRVSAYVKKYGLEINQMRKEDRGNGDGHSGFSGTVRHPMYPEDPIVLEIAPDILPHWNSALNGVVFHELYHVVQGGRRGENTRNAVTALYGMKKLTLATAPYVAAAAAAEIAAVSYINKKEEPLKDRREFLKGTTALAAGIPVYFIARDASEYVDRFDPEEWQAYQQAGHANGIPSALTSKRCFDDVRGKLFYYDKIAA
ncbi:MAG TPA: hypothetical protein VM077_03530 [Candidatus Limnocylindrales bacterium]|nr:hypothetical protein [Candidatus Limnocylindrales bacterium]